MDELLHSPNRSNMTGHGHIVWFGYLGSDTKDYLISISCISLAILGCYMNISFMCPLFRHRTEHLRVPSVRFVFHIALSDLFYGAITAIFLMLNMFDCLMLEMEFVLFFILPYFTIVSELLIILVSAEQYSEVCVKDYDREIRIRDFKTQPLLIWVLPVIFVVGTILTPFNPVTATWWFLFPSIELAVYLLTFASIFLYLCVVRRMNLDLHHQGLMDHSRSLLRQRNSVIVTHLAMSVVFLALTATSTFLQLVDIYPAQYHFRVWAIVGGILALVNVMVKPVIYVVGTRFYRDVFIRKECLAAAGLEESEDV